MDMDMDMDTRHGHSTVITDQCVDGHTRARPVSVRVCLLGCLTFLRARTSACNRIQDAVADSL